jgi:porphobilinogen synthase
MPGICRYSVEDLADEVERLAASGLRGVMLFGIPDAKDPEGTGAWAPEGPVPTAFRLLKSRLGDAVALFADVCLCEYTSHGHCGIFHNGDVDNDATLALLARAACTYADAGADVIAPSDMMDGRIAAVRSALDSHGFEHVPILSYAAKYASAFYGPFRDAADSAPQDGDRRGYQMDPPNAREALVEVEQDVAEGADMIMVKPAGPYLDVIRTVRDTFDLPLAAYQVSGEYSMIRAAAANGWLDEERAILESVTAVRRAGADMILTYFAPQLLRMLD